MDRKKYLSPLYGVYILGLPRSLSNLLFLLIMSGIIYFIFLFMIFIQLISLRKSLIKLKEALKGKIRWFPFPWRFEGEYKYKRFAISLNGANFWERGSFPAYPINYYLYFHCPFEAVILISRESRLKAVHLRHWKEVLEQAIIKHHLSKEEQNEWLMNYYQISPQDLENLKKGILPAKAEFLIKSKDSERSKSLLQYKEINELVNQLLAGEGFEKLVISSKYIRLYTYSTDREVTESIISSTAAILDRLFALGGKLQQI